jgi:DNA repair exonuclease SbcCD ATPase subunit
MPKEKVLYVCDENHNEQDVPLELRETVPYPENMHYGVKDSIHYYYICPSCSKTYLAYQKIEEPIEWTSLEQEVWDKRIANVREARVSVLKKGLDEQKTEIERVHSETERNLKENTMRKEGIIKELQKKTVLLDQLKKDEDELQQKISKESNDLSLINKKIENLLIPQPSL